LRHIPVDALDELAGAHLRVEGHVQVQAMGRQFGAQFVRCRPGDCLAVIPGPDGRGLLQQSDADKERGRAQQDVAGGASGRRVDEGAHDLRVDDLQPDGTEEQNGEEHEQHPLRGHVGRQQIPILAQGNVAGHGILSRLAVGADASGIQGIAAALPRIADNGAWRTHDARTASIPRPVTRLRTITSKKPQEIDAVTTPWYDA